MPVNVIDSAFQAILKGFFMRLLFKNPFFIRRFGSRILLFLLLFSIISCDSSDNIPIQKVDSSDRISDAELQQLQAKSHQLPHQKNKFHNHDIFYFGFDLRSSPQEDAAQYLPFLTYLETVTGYRFKLHFTSKNSSTADELGQDKTQFAAMGATSYLSARNQYGVIVLVRGINKFGRAEYRSVFVTKPGSRVRAIGDIKGRTLAFGSRDSTQGHLIPRIMLMKNGISLKDLRAYSYTGSHQNCAEAVVSGKYDVCGMQDQLANKLVHQGQLKIIHRSRYYPSSGIVANKSVPAEVITRVKQALLDFDPQGKHRQGLYHWERTEMPKGFIAANEKDYIKLRQRAMSFGFLKKSNKQEQ